MGMSTGGGGSGSVKSDINVTPLVDVVLVLLIIFLVTMPIIMRDITLEIPKKEENPTPEMFFEAQVVVEVFTDGRISINGQDVDKFSLTEKLVDQVKTKREPVVFVGFEDDVKYGDAVQIMDLVKAAGKGAGKEVKVALKMKEDKPEGGAGEGAAPATP